MPSTAAIWFCRTGNKIGFREYFLTLQLFVVTSQVGSPGHKLIVIISPPVGHELWGLFTRSQPVVEVEQLQQQQQSLHSSLQYQMQTCSYPYVAYSSLNWEMLPSLCWVIFVGEVVLDVIGYTRELDTRTNIRVFYFPIQPFRFSGLHYHKCWMRLAIYTVGWSILNSGLV